MPDLAAALFEIPEVRYIASYINGSLSLHERTGIANASSSESDKYEEIIVNPTLLKLVSQRGNIDCGGLEFVLIRYGRFFQYMQPVRDGHVSVAIEPDADVLATVRKVRDVIGRM